MRARYVHGTRVFGTWQIHEILGGSPHSTVYELRRTEREVTYRAAMKVVSIRCQKDSPADYPPAAKRAIWEQFLLYRLQGCTQIVNYGDHCERRHLDCRGWDFLTRMELLTPLGTSPLSQAEVLRLGIDMCHALETCQANGIFHRDIKPSNLFRTAHGGYKLGDFGLACPAGECPSGRVGTPPFQAPEIGAGEPFSYSADVYSLGVSLRTLLRTDAADAAALFEVLRKACAPSPTARFATARGLRMALEQYAKENPEILF